MRSPIPSPFTSPAALTAPEVSPTATPFNEASAAVAGRQAQQRELGGEGLGGRDRHNAQC